MIPYTKIIKKPKALHLLLKKEKFPSFSYFFSTWKNLPRCVLFINNSHKGWLQFVENERLFTLNKFEKNILLMHKNLVKKVFTSLISMNFEKALVVFSGSRLCHVEFFSFELNLKMKNSLNFAFDNSRN